MITAYLVGDQQLLERLHTLPGAINSGLVRGITRLAIGVQRTLQQDNTGGRVPTSRTGLPMSKSDFRIEQSGGTITASISLETHDAVWQNGRAGTGDVRTNLRRRRAAFISPSAAKVIAGPAADGVPGLAAPSFLRSALDNLTSTVRDEVDATLTQAISQ
jgi:hypothetical protein